ncbi:uncharacterized protein G2W53_040010 [Senna tora]|uniref:Uncharacterized protein n=1 Tax=Senna tora TaxID=362788 RepID=A0A834SPQ3_9FABA|nr:uncharacterized protein G2W53_040010 [Senna tora]
MLRQNEAYDTKKPPKKFQGNPTCARPNLRWMMTWIAVGRRPPKINNPWVNFFSRQTFMYIYRVKMIPMTQGSLRRSFKAIRVGRPVVDHVDRRPSKINESWAKSQVHMLSQNDPYDTRKPPKKFQGHPSRSPGGRPRGSPSINNQ